MCICYLLAQNYCLVLTFHPVFLKWNLPILNSDTSIIANGVFDKIKNRMANSVDPDYEPSHLDLHCLQKYM